MCQIFKVSRKTIYNWFNNWESSQLVGLYNSPGRGRKKLFSPEQQTIIKKWVNETPKNLEKVQEKIKKNWDIAASKETIKRVAKSFKMGWLRIKRRVSGSPLPEFFERKIQELDELKRQEEKGEIEIRYVDGAYRLLN